MKPLPTAIWLPSYFSQTPEALLVRRPAMRRAARGEHGRDAAGHSGRFFAPCFGRAFLALEVFFPVRSGGIGLPRFLGIFGYLFWFPFLL